MCGLKDKSLLDLPVYCVVTQTDGDNSVYAQCTGDTLGRDFEKASVTSDGFI